MRVFNILADVPKVGLRWFPVRAADADSAIVELARRHGRDLIATRVVPA